MVREVALITVSCVLFVQMGLSVVVQDALKFNSRILSCPKCLTMWVNLAYLLLRGYAPIESVAASFICSYCAMWLSLLYDAVACLYNLFYDTITEKTGSAEGSGQTSSDEAGGPDAVSKM